jgi:hypothetical protein
MNVTLATYGGISDETTAHPGVATSDLHLSFPSFPNIFNNKKHRAFFVLWHVNPLLDYATERG